MTEQNSKTATKTPAEISENVRRLREVLFQPLPQQTLWYWCNCTLYTVKGCSIGATSDLAKKCSLEDIKAEAASYKAWLVILTTYDWQGKELKFSEGDYNRLLATANKGLANSLYKAANSIAVNKGQISLSEGLASSIEETRKEETRKAVEAITKPMKDMDIWSIQISSQSQIFKDIVPTTSYFSSFELYENKCEEPNPINQENDQVGIIEKGLEIVWALANHAEKLPRPLGNSSWATTVKGLVEWLMQYLSTK